MERKKIEFEISGVTKDIEKFPRREWHYLKSKPTLKQAKKVARTKSNMKKWFEIEIRAEYEGETIHHSFWREGRLEINMNP